MNTSPVRAERRRAVVYGYARCSTNEARQDIDRQRRELIAAGASEQTIYWEYESGAHDDRVQLRRLMEAVQAGDTIVTTEVSRIARSSRKFCEVLEEVQARQLCLRITDGMCLDCRPGHDGDIMTVCMLQVSAAFAQLERGLISQRVRSGLQNARAKGARLGRPAVTADSIPDRVRRYLARHDAGELTMAEVARLCQCSRTTLYKYQNLLLGSHAAAKPQSAEEGSA